MNIIHDLKDPRLPLKDTAVALGLFDGVHTGHQAVLKTVRDYARDNGLTPCVFTFALADSPAGIKEGARMLTSPGMLARLLDRCGMEYAISPRFQDLRSYSGEEFVNGFLRDTLGARFVCCGTNFGFGHRRSAGAEDLERLAGEQGMVCSIVPQVNDGAERVSSTRIRELITGGDISQANRLLGYPFTIDFEVVGGNRIGRTLGTPTINQPFPPRFIIPRFGVYATLAHVDGVRYSGVTNVGIRPTVGSDGPLAETYIQDFSGDLYGRNIDVSFLEFIRSERKFDSLEELRERIYQDAATAAKIGEQKRRDWEDRWNAL